MKKRALALLLSLTVLLPTLSGAAGAVSYPEKEHLPVDYADMAYTGFDDDALQEAVVRLMELDLSTDRPDTREQVEELYRTILREYDQIETQYYLISLLRDMDVTDQWAAQQRADFADRFAYMEDQCLAALSLLAGSPYADILERDMGKEKAEEFGAYIPMTEEEAELLRREEELNQQYENAMAEEFTATDATGRAWTMEELYAAETLSFEEYYELLTRLEKAENDAAGPIFLELVDIRNRLAQIHGYDSYAEYAYEEVYNRDYSLSEMAEFYNQAREWFVPLYEEIWRVAGEDIYGLLAMPAATGEEILNKIEPYMGKLHPQLGATFQFMREHHLYDVEASPVKNDGGYTVDLPAYGSAFIFSSPQGNYIDWSVLIHEFGHFNESFHSAENGLWADFNIDVGEIHSQGLEALFIEYEDELLGKWGKGFGWFLLYHLVEAVIEACLQDEFQVMVYENPDMTLEEINKLFHDLTLEYGYEDREQGDETYYWVEYYHSFRQPMYYVSYGTSALSALDLYLLSLKDRDRAVELYMELTALGMGKPYRETIRQVGLRDPFRPGVMEELAEELKGALHEDYGIAPPKEEKEVRRELGYAVLAMAVVLPVTVGVVALASVIVIRRKRKKAGWEDDPAAVGGWKGGEKDPWE